MNEDSSHAPAESAKPPIVFISYSHDSKEHKEWAAKLALALVGKGVDVLFDQFDLGFGDDVPKFMEHAVATADRVLMVCSAPYVRKADDGKGGVGYEAMIVTGELVRDLGTNKFIPIVRQTGDGAKVVPRCVSTRLYVDMSEDSDFAEAFEQLWREIHRLPKLRKPPLGPGPLVSGNFEGAGTRAAKVERSLEFSEVLVSPEATYSRALDIVRTNDRVAWRRLLLAAGEQAGRRMSRWKEENPEVPQHTEQDTVALFAHARQGLECYASFLACLVAAAESGEEAYGGQLGWTDSILSPPNWPQEGYVYFAQFPETVLFVAQALVGGMLMESGLGEAAYRLAMTKLPKKFSTETAPLFSQYRLMDWPDSLGHRCTTAWEFLDDLIGSWDWVQIGFGSAEGCRTAVTSYYLLLNFTNFAYAAKSGELAEGQKPFMLTSPLCCLRWSHSTVQNGYRLLLRYGPTLGYALKEFKLERMVAESMWPRWMQESGKWVYGVYKNLWMDAVPHQTLFQDIGET